MLVWVCIYCIRCIGVCVRVRLHCACVVFDLINWIIAYSEIWNDDDQLNVYNLYTVKKRLMRYYKLIDFGIDYMITTVS